MLDEGFYDVSGGSASLNPAHPFHPSSAASTRFLQRPQRRSTSPHPINDISLYESCTELPETINIAATACAAHGVA